MKTINDLLGTLSPRERELHADLIDECIEREASYRRSSEKIRGDLEKLQEVTVRMLKDIEKLCEVSDSLKEAFSKANDDMLTYSLASIPDENFFHA